MRHWTPIPYPASAITSTSSRTASAECCSAAASPSVSWNPIIPPTPSSPIFTGTPTYLIGGKVVQLDALFPLKPFQQGAPFFGTPLLAALFTALF